MTKGTHFIICYRFIFHNYETYVGFFLLFCLLQQAGINLTEGQIDDLIKRLDKDKSGTVDFW